MSKKLLNKKTYHHGHLREALIKAALKLIEQKGVKALSLREIAKKAKVSHTAPYRHFQNKEDLLTAVAVEGFEMLVKETYRRFESLQNDPLIRFRETGLAYIDFAISHQSHFRVMFGFGDNKIEAPPSLVKASGESFEILLNSIIACQEMKYIKEGDPMEFALSAWSIVHGFAMLYIEGYINKFDAAEQQRLKEIVTESLFTGLHGAEVMEPHSDG